MHKATLTILDEHRSLAAVLHGLRYLARNAVKRGATLDFRLLEAMVAYIEGFPEACHHPKEDAYLFRLLRLHAPDAAPTLDELAAQHRDGKNRLAHLGRALAEYRECVEIPVPVDADALSNSGWGRIRCLTAAAAFLDSVESYATFHWKHMRIEEDVVLPLAEKTFSAADWAEMDAAFSSHQDPLHGAGTNGGDFRALFTRIVNLAPAPIGLGPALDAADGDTTTLELLRSGRFGQDEGAAGRA
ncbi:hemerythrin domain-containing protein [Vineibacter terrae]|nr:hemerythrin domain-containing protein [Vineibacter terrae]